MPRQSGVGWKAKRRPSVKNGSLDRTGETSRQLTPGTCIWVVDGWVDVAEVDLAHETIDLQCA